MPYHEDLLLYRQSLQKTILDLAEHQSVQTKEYWQRQIYYTFIQFIEQQCDSLVDEYQQTQSKPYAIARLSENLIRLITGHAPKDNDWDELKVLYQALYRPGQLLPRIETRAPKDTIEIYDHDATALISAFVKCNLLMFLDRNYKSNRSFVRHNQDQLPHNSLIHLMADKHWLKKAVKQIKTMVTTPHDYLPFNLHPVNPREKPNTPTEILWDIHRQQPWLTRFSLGRLYARITRKTEYDSYYQLPEWPADNTPKQNVLLELGHGLHFCLIQQILYQFYYHRIKNSLKDCLSYIKNEQPFFAASAIAFQATISLLKIVLLPVVLLGLILQGLTSLIFIPFRRLAQKLTDFHKLETLCLLGLDVVEALKDSLLLWACLTTFPSPWWEFGPILTFISNGISVGILITGLIALFATALPPQLIMLGLLAKGLELLTQIALSPLLNLAGLTLVLGFPTILAFLTTPRMIRHVAYGLITHNQTPTQPNETMALAPKPLTPPPLSDITLDFRVPSPILHHFHNQQPAIKKGQNQDRRLAPALKIM